MGKENKENQSSKKKLQMNYVIPTRQRTPLKGRSSSIDAERMKVSNQIRYLRKKTTICYYLSKIYWKVLCRKVNG